MTKLVDILIVEDEPALLQMYSGLFSTFTDYSYIAVASGEEALMLLDDTEFKVGVIDIRLENSINGVELGVLLHERYPNMVLYAMTGLYAVFEGFDPAIAGFEACFSKPFGFKKLFKALAKTLEKDNRYPNG